MRLKPNKHIVIAFTVMILLAGLAQPSHSHERDMGYRDDYGYGRMIPPYMMGQACCNGMYAGWNEGPGYGHPRDIFADLDLSKDQRKQIHQLYRDARSKFRALHDRMSDKSDELNDELADGYDEKSVRKLANDMAALIADRIVLRSELQNKVSKVLTPKQRDAAREYLFGSGFYYY